MIPFLNDYKNGFADVTEKAGRWAWDSTLNLRIRLRFTKNPSCVPGTEGARNAGAARECCRHGELHRGTQ